MSPFDRLYAAFAVSPDYTGPLAKDFHDMIARKWLAGMRSGHTSLGPNATDEKLVRAHLAIDWDQARGLNSQCRNLDGPFSYRTILDRLDRKRAAFKRLFYRNPYRDELP